MTSIVEEKREERKRKRRKGLQLTILDRGIGNLILTSLSDPRNHGKKLHFYSSSGGNAGLAAVIAARDLGCPCTVVVPQSTKPMMIRKLCASGAAEVIQLGASWFEADAYLRENYIDNQDDTAETQVKNIYVPPFDHPEIWRGVGTMVEEMAAQLPPRECNHDDSAPASAFPADVVVCSVGGGGLFNGVVNGLDHYLRSRALQQGSMKSVQVVAVETRGADSLAHSLRNNRLLSLPAITSLATSLGALCVAPQTLKYAESPPPGIEVQSIVGTDAEAARGVIRLSDELRLQVELACGISVEVAATETLKAVVKDITPQSRVCLVVCGGCNITPEMIADYRQKLENCWK